MNILLIIGGIFAFAYTLNSLLSVISNKKMRTRMKTKEEHLRKVGITPYGSTLSHGMYVNTKTNELKADQKQSVMWFKRLI